MERSHYEADYAESFNEMKRVEDERCACLCEVGRRRLLGYANYSRLLSCTFSPSKAENRKVVSFTHLHHSLIIPQYSW